MTTKPKNVRHSSENPRWGSPDSYVSIARSVLGLRVDGDRDKPITVDPYSEYRFNLNVGAVSILTGHLGRDGFKDRWLAADRVGVRENIGVPSVVDEDTFDTILNACPRADQVLAGLNMVRPYGEPAESEGRSFVQATALVNPPGSDDGENVKNAWRLLDAYHRLGWFGGGAVWVAFNLNQLQTLQIDGMRSPLHGDFVRCIPSTRQAFVPVVDSEKPDAPSHPSFMVLLPAYHPGVAAEQVRIFESMASKLGEVW